MQTLLDGLTGEKRDSLRQSFQLVEPTRWVIEIAHQKSWREANDEFLKHERDRGREEMKRLMTALDVERPVAAAMAADLVTAAVTLYVSPEDAEGCVERLDAGSLKVKICNCPVFRRLEASNWRGVTACGSWHRRRGWYDALGVSPADSVIAESKWGDEVCEAVIEFT